MVIGRTVLVIGAQGALGRLCAERLRDAGCDVIRAGRRAEGANDFRLIDLDDPRSVADGIDGVDLVVSTVRHASHAAERAVVHQGGMLLNVASLSAADRAELKRDTAAARGLVVVHAGAAPGIYSLIIKEMLAAHPDADGVEMAAVFSILQTSGRGGVVDFAYPALTSARRHPTRVFEFRSPIGRRRCMHVGGSEIGFFGELADGRDGRVFIAFAERWAQAEMLALNSMGAWKRLPLGFFTVGSGWKARRTTSEPRRDILAVTRGPRRLAAYAVEASGDYRMTAVATEIFATALLERGSADPEMKGIFGAEEIFELSDFRDDIEQAGVRLVSLQSE